MFEEIIKENIKKIEILKGLLGDGKWLFDRDWVVHYERDLRFRTSVNMLGVNVPTWFILGDDGVSIDPILDEKWFSTREEELLFAFLETDKKNFYLTFSWWLFEGPTKNELVELSNSINVLYEYIEGGFDVIVKEIKKQKNL